MLEVRLEAPAGDELGDRRLWQERGRDLRGDEPLLDGGDMGGGAEAPSSKPADDNVVDAEVKEVKKG